MLMYQLISVYSPGIFIFEQSELHNVTESS